MTIGFVGVPIFSIPEDGGPQRVCVEIDNPSSQDILEKTVSALLTTADGTALGTLVTCICIQCRSIASYRYQPSDIEENFSSMERGLASPSLYIIYVLAIIYRVNSEEALYS